MGKKIAIFISSLRGGGAERVMVSLANQFSEEGFDVDLVVVKASGAFRSEVGEKVNIIDLNAKRVILSFFGLFSYLRRARPDALLSTMSHANIVAILASRLTMSGLRVIVREANTVSSNLKDGGSFIDRLISGMIPYLYPRAHQVVAPSTGVANDLISRSRISDKNITTIYNPVNLELVKELAGENVSLSWFEESDVRVVLGVGRLTQQKDFNTLIQAFDIARKKATHNIKLLILGEGEEREQLEEYIRTLGASDSILLPGFVDNPYAYMARSSVFVLSSLWEGLPNVLIQALSLRVPVISTRCPSGPDEILENGLWGTLVDCGDVEAMADAILEITGQPPQINLTELDEYCENRFGAATVANEYIKLLLPDQAK